MGSFKLFARDGKVCQTSAATHAIMKSNTTWSSLCIVNLVGVTVALRGAEWKEPTFYMGVRVYMYSYLYVTFIILF